MVKKIFASESTSVQALPSKMAASPHRAVFTLGDQKKQKQNNGKLVWQIAAALTSNQKKWRTLSKMRDAEGCEVFTNWAIGICMNINTNECLPSFR